MGRKIRCCTDCTLPPLVWGVYRAACSRDVKQSRRGTWSPRFRALGLVALVPEEATVQQEGSGVCGHLISTEEMQEAVRETVPSENGLRVFSFKIRVAVLFLGGTRHLLTASCGKWSPVNRCMSATKPD